MNSSVVNRKVVEKLAIDGGTPVCSEPLPQRGLIGEEEKFMAIKVFDEAIETGNAFDYGEKYEAQYEQDFVNFMGGGFADGVNSGTNAIYCALGGLQIEPFSEVVVPPITDAGGVMPVVMMGLIPVFADSDPRTYNTSAEQIERLITERTRAIIVAHIAGDPVDMCPVMELARKHELYVIEDCAQAHGAVYRGELVGRFGDIAAFSTMSGKHHCTGGQGGVVYTKNENLHWRARRFADRGKPFNIAGETKNVVAGINCNSNELSAAIGIAQLKKLPGILKNRRLVGDAIKAGLKDCKAVSFVWQVPDSKSSYWFLNLKLDLNVIRVSKETFCDAISAEGPLVSPTYRHIQCEKPWFENQSAFGTQGFPWSCPLYKGEKKPKYDLKNAVSVTETHFNVWINERYGQKEVEKILASIKKVENAFLVA
ncbi:MAG: hypothetical protein A2Y13_05400 [Planctomycetes bacterium GWC2_45_44]|nr:MAG: hypothetical protein A2Y13_05400 [Planctomycetes bacterium GWC2_45_44]